MKKKLLFIVAILLCVTAKVNAQALNHNNYINRSINLASQYSSWNPGTALSGCEEDEYFFISRVKPMKRFTNSNTQVNTSLSPNRKVMWWCPVGGDGWTSLPRYMFDSEAYNIWSYTDIHGNWTQGFLSCPGAFSDVCHKNGVANSVVSQPAYGANLSSDGNGAIYAQFYNGGADKLLKLMKYYGIDGLGFNSECSFNVTVSGVNLNNLQTFFSQMHQKKATYGMDALHIDWYDGVRNNGSMSFGSNQLDGTNNSWFHYNGYPVCNGFFLNYNWGRSQLQNSQTKANDLRSNSSWDVYAGMDMQGRQEANWLELQNYNISIGIWGAHNSSMPYESRSKNGSSPDSCQAVYNRQMENVFTGSSRNPVNTPALTNRLGYHLGTALGGFSKLVPAKSVLSWTVNGYFPFITYFNNGNGAFFNNEGETTFNHEWYNIGIQDYMPTWRWWITTSFMGRDASNVPTGFSANICWEDAWFGGSCLKVENTNAANTNVYLHLFKTQFPLATGYEFTIRYKVLSGSATLWLVGSKEGSEGTIVQRTLGAVSASDEWQYKTVATSAWTAFNGSTLAMLGLRFQNATADFKMLIGEMSVKKAGETYTPTTPTILRNSLKQVSYKGFDFKLSWNCGANVGVDGYTPTYNADRNIWYFELWGQQEGFEPTLVSATTSWAGYGVNVPFDKNAASQRVRYGVRAVSIDGVTKSDIVWTSYEDTSSKKIISNDIEIDKPVIKANEDFTIKFSDPENAGAKSWVLKNSKNVTVATFNNAREITHSLPNVDIYNLIITFNDNSTATYNGYVVISGEEVGAMPRIDEYTFNSRNVDEAEIDISEDQHTFAYQSRDADGSSSKAITIMDNMPLAIEGGYFPRNTPVSFCAWIKITKIDESRENENQFLTLRTRNAYDSNGGSWADAYYLDSWRIMIVNPDNNVDYKLKFQFDQGNITVMNDYILPFNAWFHLAVCADANRTFDVYVNGEKKISQAVGKGNYATNGRSDFRFYASGGSVCGWNGWGGAMDDVQVWHKVLSQSEVKEAMNGYPEGATIPTDLKGYWDFESIIGEEPEEGEGEGEDEGESEPETVAPLLTTYCSTMGKPSDGGTDRGVSNIQLNGNTVSINEYSSSSRDAYRGTKNNESSAISLAKGSSYSLRVNGSLNWTYITCFADWNADGDFSDANERIGTNPNGVHSPFTSGSANASYRDFTINVPADAASAYIPLRIKMSYCTNDGETAMGTPDACTLGLYKEQINQAVAADIVLKVTQEGDGTPPVQNTGFNTSTLNTFPNRGNWSYDYITQNNLFKRHTYASNQNFVSTQCWKTALVSFEPEAGQPAWNGTDGLGSGECLDYPTAPIFLAGSPLLTGSNQIVTIPEWEIEGAEVSNDTYTATSGSINAVYNTKGTYKARLTLKNGWGDSETLEKTIVVFDPADFVGLEPITENESANMYAYPNPFVNEIYVQFVNTGEYNVEIYRLNGEKIYANSFKAESGEIKQFAVNGTAGLYLVRISDANGTVRTMKIEKK